MPLTQFVLTSAKPKEKPYVLSDGAGLHLFVQPTGSKLWRFRYRFNGKANMLGFGVFPTVGLADARSMLRSGVDPVAVHHVQFRHPCDLGRR